MPKTLYELVGRDGRRFSPHCWRARLALAHKGLEAASEPWLFTEKHLIEDAGGQVPVLDDEGRRVGDSWAIAEYLEDAYPDRRSLFGCPAGRGLAHFVGMWTSGGLQLALFPCLAKDIHDHADPADQPYFRESREKRLGCTLEEAQEARDGHLPEIERTLVPLRAHLKRQPWIAGERPMYADYVVFGAFQWARTVSDWTFLRDEDPIRDWRARVAGLFDGLADREPCYED
jgi:glutathione S-transferase